jgi:hypothetical protein
MIVSSVVEPGFCPTITNCCPFGVILTSATPGVPSE